MKKLLSLTALLAVVAISALMSGCGDDNNDGGNAVVALANVQGQDITLTPTGGEPQKYTFTTQGNNFTLFSGTNVVATGTYTYNPANNTATLTTTEDATGANQVINLVFTGSGSGTYSTTGPNNTPISGSFAAQPTTVVNPPPPSGGTNQPPPSTNPPPTTVTAPASIGGKKLQLQTLTGGPGGQELLTLTSDTTFSSDIGATGSYTYTPSGATAVFASQYQAPDAFKNDHYELTLTFNTATSGTFSGNQHFGDVDHPTTGNFALSD